MNKFLSFLTAAFMCFASALYAQQDPQFTQFMHSKLIYNPGYAGTSEAICANVLARQQWVSFPGAPKTGLLSFDMPIGQMPIAIGLNVMNDQIGFDKTLFARLALSYNRRVGAGVLGIGVDGGILQKQINGEWIAPDGKNVYDPSIPSYVSGTLTASNPGLNKLTYDCGLGIFYSVANKMYFGVSSTHLAAQDISASTSILFALARHYYIVGGYTFNMGDGGQHGLNPNIKIKSDASSTQIDLNVTYIYNKLLWAGVTYRMQDAIAPMVGYRFLKDRSLKVGYSYDLTLSKIKGYSSGTHEIMAGYCFGIKKTKKVSSYQNARFLD